LQIHPHGISGIPSSQSISSVYPGAGVYTVNGAAPGGLLTEEMFPTAASLSTSPTA
jgi:hypothetical protein